jgi:plastocyanin
MIKMNKHCKLIALGTVLALALVAFPAEIESEQQCSCCPKDTVLQHDGHHDDKPIPAKEVKGVQMATITIDGGYKPAAISVKAGKPVEITFKLGEKPGCGDVLVIKDMKLKKELRKDKPEVVKFTPKKAGEIKFECGMGMLKGKIIVVG